MLRSVVQRAFSILERPVANLNFIKKCIRIGNEVSDYLRPMDIPLHSAHTGFFLILSMFPALLLLLGLLRYTSIGAQELLNMLEGFLPQSLLPIAENLIDASYRHSSGTIVSVSVLATLWSASRGMYGLFGGLKAVYGVGYQRGYLRNRGLSMVYTFVFLLVIVATLVLHVFSNAVVDYLQMATIPALMTAMSIIDLRYVLLVILQTVLFAVLYALLPGHRNRFFRCIPGAAVASIGWLIYSKLFSIYVTYFTTYTNIFGSIYALALAMLWLYFCISILFYGAALNRWLQERTPDFFRK